ncbi:hypothetical protein J2X31_002314 [Flavobacterium arsenatis]|uniref:Uncharacterized protein n=1 Tax=Flavobacterium arsenatis TaxID=1484332 RepID=A0ABU1TQP3_9FLAO|nr:hypothetical protein [Flavobacterium arsenatis]
MDDVFFYLFFNAERSIFGIFYHWNIIVLHLIGQVKR